MNRFYLLLVASLITFGCDDGTVGPPGRDGVDGIDGVNGLNGEESFVFEYEFDFTAPEYSVLLELPGSFTMLDSDVMLIYLLWEVTSDEEEIWRTLPQTLYLPEGILAYNYDFTKFDASVFLEGTIIMDELGADFTDNWIARVVVVPGRFNGRASIDYSDYNQVKEYFDLSPSNLATEDYGKKPF
ncbi:MAG: collagen-like protein [Bacteroidota bacterium]